MANHEPQQDHGHGGHDHPEFLHHHFETPQQQFDSDKLGMWLFLMTEILMFGGLFCAYAVYRANHPEIFIYAHQFLDKTLGGINTVVLITSSFTMAWAVRAAQLNQRKLLIVLLALTLCGGFGFMSIKAVEYNHKWKHGLLWGERYVSPESHGEHAEADAGHEAAAATAGEDAAATDAAHTAAGESAEPAAEPAAAANPVEVAHGAEGEPGSVEVAAAGDGTMGAAPAEGAMEASTGEAEAAAAEPQELVVEVSNIKHAAQGPAGLATGAVEQTGHGSGEQLVEPRNVRTFFAIYFAMTGLHALHVLAGMVVIFIMMVLSIKGRFNSDYYTPIDLTGLFWHLVDLIWIFLFPLLYLIH